jgi:S1-C subfamily serine protease
VFLGRSDRFASPRWTRPLLPLGGAFVTPGALLFTLDGQFLGCAVLEDGSMAIAGATDVLETAAIGHSRAATADPGIAVQILTAELARATGAPAGVVVADVLERGPAFGVLEPGDVIADVQGQPVTGPEALLLDLGARLATGPARITVVRRGQTRTIELRPPAGTAARDAATRSESIALEFTGGGIRVVSLSDDSAFAHAGLAANDLIVRAGDVDAPAPAELRAAIRSTPRRQFVLLVVKRGQSQRILAIPGEGG